jgi:alpha-glucosidase
MDDVKELLDEAHKHDMRVIFDLVPNHTSDQSEWFKASADPDHPNHEEYKDYYIWRDPVKGDLPRNIVGSDRLEGLPEGLTVPNNWSSIFSVPQIDKVRKQYGGEIPEGVDIPAVTAWVWNGKRRQFYLAEFMKEQPSLNWANPVVREEIKSVVRFWLNLGVDSFRVDVMNHVGKDPEFKDEVEAATGHEIGEYNPGTTNPHDRWKQEKLVSHWPELGNYTNDLLSVLDEEAYDGRNIRIIFEDWMSALDHDSRLDNLRPDRANVFNFETLLNTNREHWTAKNFRTILQGYYGRMKNLKGAVPNQVSGNHDTDTLRTRLGAPSTARAAYLMFAALPGALYTWQGDMMGRANVLISKELQKDADIGMRDAERVPMQWNASKNSGFSKAEREKLWLPSVDPAVYQNDNIELQARYPQSPYRFVQAVLKRRRDDAALREGGLRFLHTDNDSVLAFARTDPYDPHRQVISITNFTQDTIQAKILDAQEARGRITLSSIRGGKPENQEIDLEMQITLPPDASYLIDSTI